jgi:hypothetical protein
MSFIFKYRGKQKKETNPEKETNAEKEMDAEKETDAEKEMLLKKSSCCGAISQAWVPSYPSLMLAPSLESLSELSSSLDSK